MENSIKMMVQFATILVTGLSAGLFYAWAVSVIPGTKRVSDFAYLETMQHINRAILNPAFFASFMGAAILLVISVFLHFKIGTNSVAWLTLAAAIAYIAGTFGVTIFGNVPLNEALDVVSLKGLDPTELANLRTEYERPWNRLNAVRTAFAMIAFALLLAALSFVNPVRTVIEGLGS